MSSKHIITNFSDVFLHKIDLFICSSSFEERCFSLPNAVSVLDPKRVIVVYNNNEYQEIITNASILSSLFKGKVDSIALDSSDPVISGLSINKNFDKIFENNVVGTVFLDTTTFTHETLLVMIRLLHFRRNRYAQLFIGYVGANDYSIHEDSLEEKWLSNGISEIRSVLGYPGSLSPARHYHLIVLFGFESERTRKLIEEYQFDVVSIGFGEKGKSINNSFQQLNCDRHEELLEAYPFAESFQVSLTNPNETKLEILKQVAKYPDHNTVIAAMSNKLSTVGIALAAIDNRKIQLIYPKAISYNVNGYSTPADDFYLYEIDF